MYGPKSIAIFGCGWLGKPLAIELLENGYCVKGSTTTPEKLAGLSAAGIESFVLELKPQRVAGDLISFLNGVDVLVINIPPKSRTQTAEEFLSGLDALCLAVEASEVERVIYVSSTSVYQDSMDFPVYSEAIEPNSAAVATEGLVRSEKIFQEASFRTTILRFGGLTGKGRHPIFHLSGRAGIPNPEAPINLIDLEDCIGIVLAILRKESFGEIYNAVFPEYPSRESYYLQKAREEGLTPPVFSKEPSIGKLICAEKVIRQLGYQYKKRP